VSTYSSDVGTSRLAAYGVYSHKVELQQVVATLNQAGYQNKDICVLLAPAHPLAGRVRDLMLLSAEADHTASARLIGWLLGLGAVVIPRAGYFIRSRGFMQALLAEPRICASLRNATTLSNLGIRESDAHRCAGLISESGGFVYVSCSQIEQSQSVRNILRDTGAEEACCLHEPTSFAPYVGDKALQPTVA